MISDKKYHVIHFRSGRIYGLDSAKEEFPEYHVPGHCSSPWGEFDLVEDLPSGSSERENVIITCKHWLTNEKTVHLATGKVYKNVDEIVAAYPKFYDHRCGRQPFVSGYRTIFLNELPDDRRELREKLMWYRLNGCVEEMPVKDTETGTIYDCVDSVTIETGCDHKEVYLHCNKQVPNPRFAWKNEKGYGRRRIQGVYSSGSSPTCTPPFEITKKVTNQKHTLA